MKFKQYLPEILFYALYLGGGIGSHFDGTSKNSLGMDVFFGLFVATIAVFVYKWQLKKRDSMVAWWMAFGWPFILFYYMTYYIFIVPAKFVLRIFGFKNSSPSSSSKPSLVKQMVDGNIQRREDDIRTLKADLRHYEERYKFEASLPPGSRSISLEVIEEMIKDIKSKIDHNENWRDFDIKQQKYRD